jgi:hypothetical protein
MTYMPNQSAAPMFSPPLPMSPAPYVDNNNVWLPPPQTYPYQHNLGSPPYLHAPIQSTPPRPTSAGQDRSMLPLGNYATAADSDVVPEQGKGERASRITQHLRLSSRNRSVSPQSHRYPLLPPPQTPVKRTLPPPPIAIPSPTLDPQSPILHSPRPILTPKQSPHEHIDMLTSRSLPKSERVEDLERMADEVAKKTQDLSSDIPPSVILATTQKREDGDINKTLPAPPIPSGKIASGISRARVDDYFAIVKPSAERELLDAPPAPTLAATRTRSKIGQVSDKATITRNYASLVPPATAESALDALERKLLEQVGTRKLEENSRKPDVRAVLPISIPAKAADPDESLNDSAISSLSLAEALDKDDKDGDSDAGKTHRGKASTVMEVLIGTEELALKEGFGVKESVIKELGAKSDGEKDKKLTKKKSREGEARKMRKAAKGKVAAWLNAVEPDPPPAVDAISPAIPVESVKEIETPPGEIAHIEEPTMEELLADIPTESEESAAPNARSSGFVPIGSLRRDALGRTLVPVVDESKHVADLWSSSPSSSSPPIDSDLTHNPWNTSKPPRKFNLPAFPSAKLDPEVKYDIRSARGGRGGQVTAVAALWTKDSANTNTKAVAPRGKLAQIQEGGSRSVTPTPAMRSPALKKSSVPALISSSHAKPTISSTASLARPMMPPSKPPGRIPPTISEMPNPVIKTPAPRTSAAIAGLTKLNKSSTPPASGTEMAFGQARLRDLIRKYQGGTS